MGIRTSARRSAAVLALAALTAMPAAAGAQESGALVIDIKPGSDTNPVNTKAKGALPVAILSTEDFDATSLDPATITFGPASARAGLVAVEDVDGDGLDDLILHFGVRRSGIQPGDTEACVTAGDLVGCDAIRAS